MMRGVKWSSTVVGADPPPVGICVISATDQLSSSGSRYWIAIEPDATPATVRVSDVEENTTTTPLLQSMPPSGMASATVESVGTRHAGRIGTVPFAGTDVASKTSM